MAASMPPEWFDGNGAADLGNDLSRFLEVKDVFKNFFTRLNAYKLNTHLGFVTFTSSSNVRVNQPLTQVTYEFTDQLKGIVPNGAMALCDALVEGKGMLTTYKSKYPEARL